MAELIKLLDAAGDVSPVSLAGASDVVSQLVVNGQQLVQVAAGIRAAHATPFNRGNVVNGITLAVTHAPSASALAAKQAAAALIVAIAAKLATATLLEFTFGAVVFRLSNAALDTYSITPRGTTVFASYTFSGGAFAVVP